MLTHIDVTEEISPVFDGLEFGDVGPYRLLRGTARGALHPDEPGRKIIVNLDKAPRNGEGLVEYSVDLEILQPVEAARGNGRILYDVLNRGDKRITTPPRQWRAAYHPLIRARTVLDDSRRDCGIATMSGIVGDDPRQR